MLKVSKNGIGSIMERLKNVDLERKQLEMEEDEEFEPMVEEKIDEVKGKDIDEGEEEEVPTRNDLKGKAYILIKQNLAKQTKAKKRR